MKKRNIIKIMLTIAILLSFTLQPFADENTSDSDGVLGTSTENLVKVGLKYGSAAAYSYTVKSASGFYVAEITDEGFVGINSKKESVTLFSAKAYVLYIGFSVEIGFNFSGFLKI